MKGFRSFARGIGGTVLRSNEGKCFDSPNLSAAHELD